MKRFLLGCALIGFAPALASASQVTVYTSGTYGQEYSYVSGHQVAHRSSGVSISLRIGSSGGTQFRYTQRHFTPTHLRTSRAVVVHHPVVVHYPAVVIVQPAPRYRVLGPPVRRHATSGLRYSHPYDNYHYYYGR